jgi:hypothetical protein
MALLSILQDVALIIASCTAIYGINAWRRGFVGRRRIKLSEEILVLFYEARDAIRFMRSPLGYVGEGESRPARDGEFPDEKEIRNKVYVLVERFNKRQEVFSKIQTHRYRFMAQFGKETAQPFDELHHLIIDLFSASEELADLRIEQRHADKRDDTRRDTRDRIRELERVFWGRVRDDPIAPRVEAIVARIESICRSEIDKGNTSYRVFGRIRKLIC